MQASTLYNVAKRKDGMTLVEVVCGLALVGTLLSSLILAHSAHSRQIREATLRIEAVQTLDATLMSWRQGQLQLEPGMCIESPQNDRLWIICARRLPQQADENQLGCWNMRVEIFLDSKVVSSNSRPITSVDLLQTNAQ